LVIAPAIVAILHALESVGFDVGCIESNPNSPRRMIQ